MKKEEIVVTENDCEDGKVEFKAELRFVLSAKVEKIKLTDEIKDLMRKHLVESMWKRYCILMEKLGYEGDLKKNQK
jgi:hypothetical protein